MYSSPKQNQDSPEPPRLSLRETLPVRRATTDLKVKSQMFLEYCGSVKIS
jgi:hypothetical protein